MRFIFIDTHAPAVMPYDLSSINFRGACFNSICFNYSVYCLCQSIFCFICIAFTFNFVHAPLFHPLIPSFVCLFVLFLYHFIPFNLLQLHFNSITLHIVRISVHVRFLSFTTVSLSSHLHFIPMQRQCVCTYVRMWVPLAIRFIIDLHGKFSLKQK